MFILKCANFNKHMRTFKLYTKFVLNSPAEISRTCTFNVSKKQEHRHLGIMINPRSCANFNKHMRTFKLSVTKFSSQFFG